MECNVCKVSIVNTFVSDVERTKILEKIERIAYEIAQECDSDELCELDAI